MPRRGSVRSLGKWTAWYPGSDWSVTAADEPAVTRKLMIEVAERGETSYKFKERIYARQLRDAIPGIYAMEIVVFNQLRETESREDIDCAFREAEAARVAGRNYTKADYLRAWPSS